MEAIQPDIKPVFCVFRVWPKEGGRGRGEGRGREGEEGEGRGREGEEGEEREGEVEKREGMRRGGISIVIDLMY